jgi:hypothetical protein
VAACEVAVVVFDRTGPEDVAVVAVDGAEANDWLSDRSVDGVTGDFSDEPSALPLVSRRVVSLSFFFFLSRDPRVGIKECFSRSLELDSLISRSS